MSIISWNNNIILNHKTIDEQHEQLVIMVNKFYELIRRREANPAIMELLKGAIDYTAFHFSHEEDLMRQHRFPDSSAHIKEHQEFVDHVTDCHQRISEGKLVISLEITNFLRTWLVDHIKGTDKKLCDFLAQREQLRQFQ